MEPHSIDVPNHAKLRVSVSATSGVYGGVFKKAALERLPRVTVVRSPAFAASACSLLSVVKGETTCNVRSDAKLVYLVRDRRSEVALAGGVVFAAKGMLKPMESATAINRVTITIYQWDVPRTAPEKP